MKRGFTLLELMVVLVLLGVMLSVSALAFSSSIDRGSRVRDELRAARADAIRSGVATSVNGVLFLPDGRAIGPGMDALTGVPNAR